MSQFVGLIDAIAVIAATIFFGTLAGSLFGAFSGWVVALTPLGDWIKHVLGNPNYTLVELGALLGFVGAFFRSTSSSKKD